MRPHQEGPISQKLLHITKTFQHKRNKEAGRWIITLAPISPPRASSVTIKSLSFSMKASKYLQRQPLVQSLKECPLAGFHIRIALNDV